jgi:tetratricopeptide (TPR) repeat protein
MNRLNKIEVVKGLIKQSKFVKAEIILRDIPNSDKNPEVQQLLGVVAFQTNRVSEAVVYFQKAAIDLPKDGYLQNNLAQSYKILGFLDEAKLAFKNAAKYQTKFADPLNHLGLLLMQEGEEEQAEIAFLNAISRHPNYAEAHYNLGVLLEKLDRLVEAREHYQQAVRAKPDYIQALNNLGVVLDTLGEYKAAEKIYRKVILTSPNIPELHCSLGSCLRQQGKYIAARNEFLKAADLAPNFFINKWNLGFLQLAMAELPDGWSNYRYRHTVDRQIFPLPNKRLAHELRGQTFKIAAEQGLGDQIFFSRFLSQLKNRGATVKFQPDPKIKSLFERVEGIVVEELNEPDFSIADLPYLLGNNAVVPSVSIRPEEKARLNMLRRLSDCGPPPYIGLTYRAGGAGENTLYKNCTPDAIISILSEISATVIIVQRYPKPKELMLIFSQLGRKGFDFSDVNENLEDALALMTHLDDYIGVSNTNMHLRAATGKGARVLVTHPGEFRWQVHGDTSPWFPEFTLYRQSINSNWENAFAKLKIKIKEQYG